MGNADQVVLSLDQVAYAYGHRPLWRELSLSVRGGESVALLGANGSGKSTLLKMLAGLVFPSRGHLSAFGRKVDERVLTREDFGMYFRASVGFVFQSAEAQLFNASVFDEIAFGPRQIERDEVLVRHRVEAAMEAMSLSALATRSPFELSGGEKRKVALASVLVMDPEILLLDEPTTGLDPRSTRLLTERLETWSRGGKTMILATHDLELAGRLTSRAILLDERHRIVADAATKDVLEDQELLRNSNLV